MSGGPGRVGALAAELGYGSESAFSNAFKREVGQAPLHYRRRCADSGAARLAASSAPAAAGRASAAEPTRLLAGS